MTVGVTLLLNELLPAAGTGGVGKNVTVGVTLLLNELLAGCVFRLVVKVSFSLEAEAPVMSEAVGETLTMVPADTVVLEVEQAVPVPVGEVVPDGVAVGLKGGLPLLLSE